MKITRRTLANCSILIVWLFFVGVICVIYFAIYQERRAQLPVKTEIERAIEVKGLENKFVFTRHMLLGGAGGGGFGAPMVICSSPKQFVDLIPKEEPIFVAFEFPVIEETKGVYTNYSIKKVYWAFIENRAGIMVYEDEYSYNNCWVEHYNSKMIYFYYRNLDLVLCLICLWVLFGGIGALYITGFILYHNE